MPPWLVLNWCVVLIVAGAVGWICQRVAFHLSLATWSLVPLWGRTRPRRCPKRGADVGQEDQRGCQQEQPWASRGCLLERVQ